MTPRGERRVPERTCVQCGSAGRKESFLRIAGRPGSAWEPDPDGRKGGRGIYVCRTAECVERFARRVRTPKGASRWKMGTNGIDLAEKVSAWWTAESRK